MLYNLTLIEASRHKIRDMFLILNSYGPASSKCSTNTQRIAARVTILRIRH
jgi:hypothetical protein